MLARRSMVALPLALCALRPALAKALPVSAFATSAGALAYDGLDGTPGNPFATALLAALAQQHLPMSESLAVMARVTRLASQGRQKPDLAALAGEASLQGWRLCEPAERRTALVLAFADYPRFSRTPPLPGALHDALRVSAGMRAAGWNTSLSLDPPADHLSAILDGFADTTATADAAMIYTTGHGFQRDGAIRLLPSDYAAGSADAELVAQSVPLLRLASALGARTANLLFYAGCRDDPFA